MRDRDVNDNDIAGVFEDVSDKPKILTKYIDPSIKKTHNKRVRMIRGISCNDTK